MPAIQKTPVILDTDIGTDIDDTWALGLLLNCPELDVKLITVASGDTLYRAKIVAKFLETVHRQDIPIGIGPAQNDKWGPQAAWVIDYDLQSFPGCIHKNGIQALIETIHANPGIKLIVIGPMTNIGAALEQDASIQHHASVIAMAGSVYEGYNGNATPAEEYNVVQDIKACHQVFAAAWPITITPLDTCGKVVLRGDAYQKVLHSILPIPQAIIENYEIWAFSHSKTNFQNESSVLFDTVAIYLAISAAFLEFEDLHLEINQRGVMIVGNKGKMTRCAVRWRDIDDFYTWLVNRLAYSMKK